MKKFVIATVALAAVALFAWPASAAWAYRTVTRYDPYCGHLVPVTERYWVPDCVHAQPYPHGSGYGGYGYGSGYGYGAGFGSGFDRFGYSNGGYGPSPYQSEFGSFMNRSPWR